MQRTVPLDLNNLPPRITFDRLIFDVRQEVVWIEQRRLNFTRLESRFLLFLAVSAKNGVTAGRNSAMQFLYPNPNKLKPDSKTLDAHINSIRKKLRKAHAGCYIETIWGIGHELKKIPSWPPNKRVAAE